MSKGEWYEIVTVRGLFLDKYIVWFERKCFGWEYQGCETVDVEEGNADITTDSYGDVHVRQRHKFVDELEFQRKSHYTNNILFNLTEFLNKIVSFCRRFLMIFMPIVIVIVAGAFGMEHFLDAEGAVEGALAVFSVYGGIVLFFIFMTLILSGLGFFYRKIFKIGE